MKPAVEPRQATAILCVCTDARQKEHGWGKSISAMALAALALAFVRGALDSKVIEHASNIRAQREHGQNIVADSHL